MDLLTVKSLHIIFVVSWFAGLFYIVRLFIYHVEAQEKTDVEKSILSNQFIIMQKKLWWIITTPAMVLTVIFGTWMVVINPSYLYAPWFQIKLVFVCLLLIYHFLCQRIMMEFKRGVFKWKSTQLRLWNELATLFLVAIVFLVVLKSTFNWITGTLGFFGVAVGLMLGIQLYKKLRSK
ncbi:MAG: protoporphyrinogen oxidase HemJ [Crocinitomicaceae bacterium]|nr:MAG: protoporphyrinogen oxidase HemJ [Crocinitomicaceae bacterium]